MTLLASTLVFHKKKIKINFDFVTFDVLFVDSIHTLDNCRFHGLPLEE